MSYSEPSRIRPVPVHVVAAPRAGARTLVELLALSPDFSGAAPRCSISGSPDDALQIAALAAAHPDARFVYLYRDPRETLSSMLDAWRSGRFVTEPALPGWPGPPWSLVLVPAWRALAGLPLGEVVAHQWAACTTALLDGLEALPPARWCVSAYDRLASEPADELRRVAAFAGLAWDDMTEARAVRARPAVHSPDPGLWHHNAVELEQVWPVVAEVARRAHDLFARPPATRPAHPPTTTEVAVPDQTEPDDRDAGFRSVNSGGLAALLHGLGVSLWVSTYQSGRVIVVRTDGEELNTHFRAYASPMGIAVDRERLAIGTRTAVLEHHNQAAVAAKLLPEGRHDAAYLPRLDRITGEVLVHEVAYLGSELWVVATRFSCLASLDDRHSFVPRWRPPFVTALAAEDRCHLNGMAVVDGAVRYVTAMGETDTPGGWRDHKVAGGVVLEVASGEVVASGLSMPHSPRVHDGQLWVLSSGRGEVGTVDPATGAFEVVAKLPGFTRGLAFAGPYAFVGLSQVRETVFGGIPLAEELDASQRRCGVWVIDTRSGATVAFLRFEGTVQEIFDVQVLAGVRWPELVEVDSPLTASSFVLPDDVMAEVHQPRP